MQAHRRPEHLAKTGIAFAGIDLGTSGCRGLALDENLTALTSVHKAYPLPWRAQGRSEQDPSLWWEATCEVLQTLQQHLTGHRLVACSVAGTSGSCLLTDQAGTPLTPGMMYDDARGQTLADQLAAGGDHPASDSRSSLARLLWLEQQGLPKEARHFQHQADWIGGRLCAKPGHSDYHNALRLGFDANTECWPDWVLSLVRHPALLPRVTRPGRPYGPVTPELARRLGLDPTLEIVAGTTDSIAAFLAAGACLEGDAVSSFGSTIALKMLTRQPVQAARYGVYSHRLGDLWLAGGASNAGGAVLAHYFTAAELSAYSAHIKPEWPTGLDYYPLLTPGERFPIADPAYQPRLDPKPANPIDFLHGLLEGLASIEAQGYRLLATLGASPLKRIWSSGQTGTNPALRALRERLLGQSLRQGPFEDPAAGAALLAAAGSPRPPAQLWHSWPILGTLARPIKALH